MSTEVYYALFQKKTLSFHLLSHSREDLERRINKGYWAWRGMQPVGTNPGLDEYLEGKIVVEVSVNNV